MTAICQFQASWTGLLQPLIYLHSGKLCTLSLGLFNLLNQYGRPAADPASTSSSWPAWSAG